ncbi:potassium transporter Kup [Salsipaludibacter albus]|uniref:potassium transporter Kup n=1 Tax=Salsipaludibacter albus TaxID=2849650 RepID=UPI001EE3BF5B|nr:KUP/HAK/KT family potassium transporter [Salsipaludibacter albus]MBY5164127.1 KUP/HAK/KT family potassium transporter [Salsipaludibacter albus]
MPATPPPRGGATDAVERRRRRRQASSGGLLLAALGVVFGDIATSPLYALRETLGGAEGVGVDRVNVLGVLSLVLWSLIIVVTVKYVLLVLRADNHGEGGILALTTLMRRSTDTRLTPLLVALGLFGTALLYGDGAITPAISVLSAVEGLQVVRPELGSWVLPISVAILVALFAVQRFGTGAIGAAFGPVMVVWFAVLAILGVVQVVQQPEVLVAIDPRHGIRYFAANGFAGFASLGAVFLVVTGGEALYADMGHVGVPAIRRGWFTIVMPALVLAYLGQGALLLRDPGAIDSPFFRMGPTWATGGLVVLATAATIIASQALISGAFSLTMQAVQVDHLPRVAIRNTSRRHAGQVYVPAVNWLLMVACVGLVVGFGSSSALAAAYGVAVTATMAITTILFAVVAVQRLGWSRRRAVLVAALFLVVDLAFFGANLLKIPDGGWFPLVVAGLVFLVMRTWHDGRALVARRLRRDRVAARTVVAQATASRVTRVPGTAFYLHPRPEQAPPALLATLRSHHVLHQQVVLVAITVDPVPLVPRARQVRITELGDGLLQLDVHVGFAHRPNLPSILREVEDPVFDLDDSVFVLGREHLTSTARPFTFSRLRERLFIRLHRNATDAADWYGLPADRVIEVGSVVEL